MDDKNSKLRGLQGDELQEKVNSLTAEEIAKEAVMAENLIELGQFGLKHWRHESVFAYPMISRGEEILKAISRR